MKIAKPFLKWAGGKTQLINDIKNLLPKDILYNDFTYIEPFIGSGAVFFWMANNLPNMKKAVINDVNKDLINTYKSIADNSKGLITILEDLQNQYYMLESDDDKKKEFYYKIREEYNTRKSGKIEQAAFFIFLNKTCFNGLYRVNRKNQYNVPIGSYKKPTICDKENILAVSKALQNVEILCTDYEETLNFANANTFFYFDPPYKPLSETSNFNSYSKSEFNDDEQIRLNNFCKKIDKLGHKFLLSNSDMKNNDIENNYFDELYSDFNITRVKAKRYINSNSAKRGKLNELLIKNYENEKTIQTA